MIPETIVAPATAPGQSGISVIRVSGARSFEACSSVCGDLGKPRMLKNCSIKNSSGEVIDSALVAFFVGPSSYTGEDVVEIHCHGNPVIVDMVIQEILSKGVRVAEPGEFTKRAFLNGKLDLAQAEAVSDLISAQSDVAVLSANSSLSGEFSKKINELIKSVVGIRVFVEASIDFPDEEIPEQDLSFALTAVKNLQHSVGELLKASKQGVALREGSKVVIIGPPNSGKSTLLNVLAKEDLAMVSGVAGTTRDLIKAKINLKGVPVEFVDTAGIRKETRDPLELEGMSRAHKTLNDSALVVLLSEPGVEWVTGYETYKNLKVCNKLDLGSNQNTPNDVDVFISAKEGKGISELIDRILKEIGFGVGLEAPMLSRRRHVECLTQADSHLGEALGVLKNELGLELAAECLTLTQKNLGNIVNPVSADDLLGEIFSEFCIGK